MLSLFCYSCIRVYCRLRRMKLDQIFMLPIIFIQDYVQSYGATGHLRRVCSLKLVKLQNDMDVTCHVVCETHLKALPNYSRTFCNTGAFCCIVLKRVVLVGGNPFPRNLFRFNGFPQSINSS